MERVWDRPVYASFRCRLLLDDYPSGDFDRRLHLIQPIHAGAYFSARPDRRVFWLLRHGRQRHRVDRPSERLARFAAMLREGLQSEVARLEKALDLTET